MAVLAVLAVLGTGLGGGAIAAAQAVAPVDIVGTDLSDFPTIRLSVAASGDAAGSLDPAEIQVTENGEPVQAEVVSLSEQAIDVVLVIDISGSMAGDPLDQAKDAALEFLDELPAAARTAVVSFETEVEVVSGLTDARDESRAAVEGLTEGEGTALYDGINVAVEEVSGSDRSAIVVLSDGADTSSFADIESVEGALGGADTDFVAISLQTEGIDEAALDRLAVASGGQVVPASDPDALAEAYVDLGQRISNQFELVFESTTPDPTATFEVTVASTGDSDAVEIALPDRSGADSPTTTEVAQAEIEPLVVERDPGPLEQGWALWLGALMIAVAIGVTAYFLWPEPGTRPVRRRLDTDRTTAPDAGAGERMLASVRETATRIGSRAVERSEQSGVIDASLDRAGIVMRAGEFVAVVAGVAIAAGFVLYLLLGVVGIAIGIFVPILGAPTFLKFLAKRRNAKFGDQLGDTLMLMSGALRSGFGIGAAIDNVAQEMEAPIGVEFQRAILETRLGRTMEDSLASIAKRVQNEDFEWVVDAIRIHHQVGGDLAQILDQVAETIRARTKLRRQISALTAEGRLSGIVLGAMPLVMAGILFSSNPDYMRPLFTRTGGQIMLAFAVVLLVTGALWLKKLIDVEL